MPSSAVLVMGNCCVSPDNGSGSADKGASHRVFPLYRFVQWILKSNPQVDVVLLSSYEPNQHLPTEFANNKRVHVLYGSGLNEQLVTSTIDKHKIETIFYDDTTPPNSSDAIVEQARVHLLSLTHTLEAIRKSEHVPNFVPISMTGGQAGIGKSLSEARITSSQALLHAFATSYRIPIKAAKLDGSGAEFGEGAFRFVAELFPIGGGVAKACKKAQVVAYGPESSPTPSNVVPSGPPAARFLIYGARNWIGSSLIRHCHQRGVHTVDAKLQPGLDSDPSIAEEINSTAPSHVIYVMYGHHDGCESGEYLNGEGPTNLLHNMQRHFYSAWTLANMCVKRGIHFTYVATSSLHTQRMLAFGASGNKDGDEGFNRFSVVEKWASRSLELFKPIRGGVLQVHIQRPFSGEAVEGNFLHQLLKNSTDKSCQMAVDDEEGIFSATHLPSCLPLLLESILNMEKGRVDLVNPHPTTTEKVLKQIKEIVVTVPKVAQEKEQTNRSGQVLGDKLVEKIGSLPSTEQCISQSLKELA